MIAAGSSIRLANSRSDIGTTYLCKLRSFFSGLKNLTSFNASYWLFAMGSPFILTNRRSYDTNTIPTAPIPVEKY